MKLYLTEEFRVKTKKGVTIFQKTARSLSAHVRAINKYLRALISLSELADHDNLYVLNVYRGVYIAM